MKDKYKDIEEVKDLAEKITKVLPIKPDNIGIPIMALQLAKANYMEYLRNHIPENELENFQNLVQQSEILTNHLIEVVYDQNKGSN